jgi:hypothetical protein
VASAILLNPVTRNKRRVTKKKPERVQRISSYIENPAGLCRAALDVAIQLVILHPG